MVVWSTCASASMDRGEEIQRVRTELLAKYGEAFKERIFEKAVEKGGL